MEAAAEGVPLRLLEKWINIKHQWKLSVTSEEKSALKQMLSTCR